MDRMQRMSLISLSLVVVLAIGLSLKSFGARLRAPFHLLPAAEEVDVAAQEAEQLLRLKVTDTDKDGLSDYDEMYVYRTSPYIPDSDSDGYSDAEEVKTGNDPNCPKGSDCSTGIVGGDVNSSATVTSGAPATTPAVNPYTITDPAQIRAFIAATGGVSAADLAKIDDASLLELWSQVKQSASSTSGSKNMGSVSVPAPGSSSTTTPAKLPVNPPAAEVRRLLEASGISKDVLKSVDDATLLNLYEQTRLEQEAKTKTGE